MIYENDLRRTRVAFLTYPVFGILQGIALARYPDDMQWDHPAAGVYLGVLGSTFVLGAYGWLATRQIEPEPEPVPAAA